MSTTEPSEPPDAGPTVATETDGPDELEVRNRKFQVAGVAAVILLLVGTIVYHQLEDWSWVDSFYFCTIAVTTVGFGDFSPTTDATKLFTVFYVFAGISLIGVVLDERMKRHAERASRRGAKRRSR